MNAVAKKPAKKKAKRLIYLTVRKLVDPLTGEEIGALVPSTKWDRRTMKERKFHVGIQLRGELRQARNVKFYRLAHVLGAWLADNVEGFEGLSQHDALKRLQELSGIGCSLVTYEIPNLGTLQRNEAVSLNFEDMDEGEFAGYWDGGTGEGGWLGWLRREKWGLLSADQVEDVEALVRKEGDQ